MNDKPPPISPSGGSFQAFGRWLNNILKRLLKFKIESTKELKTEVDYLHQIGGLNHDILAMINGALSIGDMTVGDIMVPKSAMKCIDANAKLHELLNIIQDTLHSRYPVVDENNKPIGLLFAKDIITHAIKATNTTVSLSQRTWIAQTLMRQAERVPENMSLPMLLRQFRSGKNHLAIVLDEFGEMVGLITIEDVLEQIVGEIKDEHDNNETIWILDHGNHSTVKAQTPIEVFNNHFGSQLEAQSGETLASAIIEQCEHLPSQGETIELENFSIQVLKVDSRRLHLLSVKNTDSQQSNNTNPKEKKHNSDEVAA